MGKRHHASLAMTGICLILGVIIGIQAKTVKKQTTAFDIQRVNELSFELKKALEENQNLTNKLTESEKKLWNYEKSIADEDESSRILNEELTSARMVSGFTELEGRGITVSLDDSTKVAQEGSGINANAFLVHAEDILSVINELNTAGAEAVSINGQRIIGTSSVRCAGSVVNINGVKIAAPFVVSAIGDPDILESALKFPGGVVDSLMPWGIDVSIKKLSNVVVAKYDQAIIFKESKISEGE